MAGMTLEQATAKADRLNKVVGVTARVVRILPESIDPPRKGDTGHDVEVTVDDDAMPSRSMARRIRAQVAR